MRDRVAIVTGASRGIGRRIALELARAGAKVALAARTVRPRQRLPGTLGEAEREIRAAGGTALAVPTDVRDAAALDRLVARTLEAFGRIDVVVHNAGALWWRPALETPAKRFDLVMEVNVRAAFLLSVAAARVMAQAGRGGHVILISPPLDSRPHPGMVAYTISKFGMTQAAIGLAEELRPHRIAVNTLWPATLVESLATINFGLGGPAMWRCPSIVADAVLALVRRDPAGTTGRQLIDEDLLREEGVVDFSRYRRDPESEPPKVPYSAIAPVLERLGRLDRDE